MKLDEKTVSLIMLGASVSANCNQCLQTSLSKAKENGCNEQEIADSIIIGKMVRRGAASKMDGFITKLEQGNTITTSTLNRDHGCVCS
jgi:AhpD family alkylhydroperoxidase